MKASTMLDNNKILEALRTVKDPSTGQDIISVRMVGDFKLDGNNVHFSLNIPNQDTKVKQEINFACIGAVQSVYPDAQVHIHMKNDTPAGSTKANPLPHVANIIAVASGKG